MRGKTTLLAAIFLPSAAIADNSMNYLHGSSLKTAPIVALTWGLIGISAAVVLIVCALLIIGLLRRRAAPAEPLSLVVRRTGDGLPWIYGGTALTIIVLIFTTGWTYATVNEISAPPSAPALTVEITAHQWWWGVRYLTADDERVFTTANEIHIPVGAPVRLRLISPDVIHSFWVPQLGGKTQIIPGQINTTWIEADRTGRFRGQCTQFCGLQHAHMAMSVIADSPDMFHAWWNDQIRQAAPATDDGAVLFVTRCGSCHAVRGTDAAGIVGPDLSHLMTRATLAAGTLPNSAAALDQWIADPQRAKPGTLMPVVALSDPERAAVTRYLRSLE